MAGSKPYKPERPVSSELFRELLARAAIEDVFFTLEERNDEGIAYSGTWKRVFRKGLPLTKTQMRGYVSHCYLNRGGVTWYAGIGVSDSEDQKVIKQYLLHARFRTEKEAAQAVKDEAAKLAVMEVMFS